MSGLVSGSQSRSGVQSLPNVVYLSHYSAAGAEYLVTRVTRAEHLVRDFLCKDLIRRAIGLQYELQLLPKQMHK